MQHLLAIIVALRMKDEMLVRALSSDSAWRLISQHRSCAYLQRTLSRHTCFCKTSWNNRLMTS